MEPKGRAKKTVDEVEEPAVEPVAEVQEQVPEPSTGVEETSVEAGTSIVTPLSEVLGHAEKA